MPVSKDEPRDLKSMLRSFHLDNPDWKDYMPRDPVEGPRLPPGLEDTTGPRGFKRPYNRWGEDKLEGFEPPNCRFCGTKMYFHHETNDSFVFACPYPDCPNNPESKGVEGKDPYMDSTKRPIGSLKENHW